MGKRCHPGLPSCRPCVRPEDSGLHLEGEQICPRARAAGAALWVRVRSAGPALPPPSRVTLAESLLRLCPLPPRTP